MTATTEISFERAPEDDEHIEKILDRAHAILSSYGTPGLPERDRLSNWMDLVATHANGCPMDFERLSKADDFSFLHDFCGIARHLDRTTGQLGNSFHPRFARKEG